MATVGVRGLKVTPVVLLVSA